MSKLMTITRDEFNRLRICELDNRKYDALVEAFDARTGRTGKADRLIRKHWMKTLRQFDDNGYLSIIEVFQMI